VNLALPDDERVALLMEDYEFFVRDRELFCERLGALTQLRGQAVVEEWQSKARAGDVESVVRELLVKHYDPSYAASIHRNFKRYAQACSVALADGGPETMAAAARTLTAIP
jgi:tRNA 2-selenouridine synthase